MDGPKSCATAHARQVHRKHRTTENNFQCYPCFSVSCQKTHGVDKGKYTIMYKWLYKLGNYYLIPHELLHVVGYRIIGKPCHYRWGDRQVVPLVKRNRHERLFVGLLPFIVSWLFGGIFYLAWLVTMVYLAIALKLPPEKFFLEAPKYHFIFMVIGSIFIIYGGTAHGDLITAYYLLFGKEEKEKAHDYGRDPQDDANKQQI